MKGAGGAVMFRLTSPQAPSVEPMFLVMVEKTVFRSFFSTPCSWYACRVVSRRDPLPYWSASASIVRYRWLVTTPAGCRVRSMNW